MKPAEGKVHKSCAIRCVSGGIPPVFRVKTEGKNTYYVLRGAEGEPINKEILPFIGEPVSLNGEASEENGWGVLKVTPTAINYLEQQ